MKPYLLPFDPEGLVRVENLNSWEEAVIMRPGDAYWWQLVSLDLDGGKQCLIFKPYDVFYGVSSTLMIYPVSVRASRGSYSENGFTGILEVTLKDPVIKKPILSRSREGEKATTMLYVVVEDFRGYKYLTEDWDKRASFIRELELAAEHNKRARYLLERLAQPFDNGDPLGVYKRFLSALGISDVAHLHSPRIINAGWDDYELELDVLADPYYTGETGEIELASFPYVFVFKSEGEGEFCTRSAFDNGDVAISNGYIVRVSIEKVSLDRVNLVDLPTFPVVIRDGVEIVS